MRDISEIGLNCESTSHPHRSDSRLTQLLSSLFSVALELVDNFAKTEEAGVADSFFQQYTVRLVTDIFSVLVDPDQRSGTSFDDYATVSRLRGSSR